MRILSKVSLVAVSIFMNFSCVNSNDDVQLESATHTAAKKKKNVDPGTLCSLPLADGNCDGYFPSWAYDVEKDACVRFVYGGCGGNDNRFESKEECQRMTRNCKKAK